MNKKDWVSAELDRVYPDSESVIRQSIVALMSTWQRMAVFGLKTKTEQQEVIDAFVALTSNKVIPVDTARSNSKSQSVSRVWKPAGQFYRLSSIARVRPDYSNAEDGWKYNAREGVIVGVRGGYMIVRFNEEIDGAPSELRDRPANFEVDVSHLNTK